MRLLKKLRNARFEVVFELREVHFLAQLKVRIVVFTFRVRHVGFVSSFLELVKLGVDSGKRLLDLFLEFLAKFPNALGVT